MGTDADIIIPDKIRGSEIFDFASQYDTEEDSYFHSLLVELAQQRNDLFPTSITNIYFYHPENIRSITIPASVKLNIEYGDPFKQCPGIHVLGVSQEILDEAVARGYNWARFEDKIQAETPIKDEPVDEEPEREVSVYIAGMPVVFDQPPIIYQDRTLVPLRAIFEALGAEVLWDGNTQTVTATRGSIKISLQIASTQMYVNDDIKTLDVPAKLINSRTLVPVRAVSEAFGCLVDWNEETKIVYITTK